MSKVSSKFWQKICLGQWVFSFLLTFTFGDWHIRTIAFIVSEKSSHCWPRDSLMVYFIRSTLANSILHTRASNPQSIPPIVSTVAIRFLSFVYYSLYSNLLVISTFWPILFLRFHLSWAMSYHSDACSGPHL